MARDRESFSNDYKWDVSVIYKTEEEFLKSIKNLREYIKKYNKFKDHILDNENNLLELLELDSEIGRNLEKTFIYAHLNNDADTTNEKYQEQFGQAKNLYSEYLEATSFIVPELLKSDFSIVEGYINKLDKLKKYERSLKDIFRMQSHVLSSEVESALATFSKLMDAPDEIMSTLSDSDFKFDDIVVNGKNVPLTESNFSVYLRDNDRSVRCAAFKSIYKTYASFKNTIATILRNEVEKNVASAKLRGYKSSLDASLFRNEIDPLVYENLIKGIHKNMDAIYDYWQCKKKILKLDDFHLYDTYANIESKSKKTYTFEEAKELVLKAVKPLGDTYIKDIKNAFSNGWIDSCNNTGKRGGAYCTACYDAHPFVLLSFEGILNDVSTLAHELGHAMHYYYAVSNQTFEDYGYSIFVAEVASQVNEILLSRYLLDNSTDDNEKVQIIDDLLQKFKASMFRQTMFAEFEKYLYEYTENGNVLTSDVMCNKYYELNKEYFGDDVIIDDEIKFEWERIPHFYMNFYVYQYATGFAAAVKIANDIYEGNTKARDKYLEFLKLGCTKNPIDSLKVAGVDMMNTEVIDDAIDYMRKLLDMYKELKESEVNE